MENIRLQIAKHVRKDIRLKIWSSVEISALRRMIDKIINSVWDGVENRFIDAEVPQIRSQIKKELTDERY
jgi:hypothetical protein